MTTSCYKLPAVTPRMRPRIPRILQLLRSSQSPSTVRFFAHLNHPASHRPQLPFLATRSRQSPTLHSRWISTERKKWIVTEVGKGVKYTLIIWTFGALFFVIAFGAQQEYFERRFPSPHEWTWNTRRNYRSAKWADAHEDEIDWARQGSTYRHLIKRLETKGVDGDDVLEQEEGGILVAGVGETGFDTTRKPESWRRGYFDCLMGAGRAAEHLDDWVRDRTRDTAFPVDSVVGPSNPNPKPLLPGAPPAPREEDCEPAFEKPETYYMKILTTAGFTPKQRIEAALAYASWLDYKNTPESAREMYKWALDIVSTEQVFDITGQLNPSIPVSSNLLTVTTAMAVHQARTNNLTMALPLFLSVLRTRRSLPVPATINRDAHREKEPNASIFSNIRSMISSAITPPAYPLPGPDGTELPVRDSRCLCEEAGLMAYIGEILYASGSGQANKEDGLAWTRESVDVSEEVLRSNSSDINKETETVCRDCLGTGLDNWRIMVSKMAETEREKKRDSIGKKASSWFGLGGSGDCVQQEEGKGRWESEETVVVERAARASVLLSEGLRGKRGESGYLFA